MDTRLNFDQIKWFGDEILCAGRECPQLVIWLGSNHEYRKVARFGFLKVSITWNPSMPGICRRAGSVIVVFYGEAPKLHRDHLSTQCKHSRHHEAFPQAEDIGLLIVNDQNAGVKNFLFANHHVCPVSICVDQRHFGIFSASSRASVHAAMR